MSKLTISIICFHFWPPQRFKTRWRVGAKILVSDWGKRRLHPLRRQEVHTTSPCWYSIFLFLLSEKSWRGLCNDVSCFSTCIPCSGPLQGCGLAFSLLLRNLFNFRQALKAAHALHPFAFITGAERSARHREASADLPKRIKHSTYHPP